MAEDSNKQAESEEQPEAEPQAEAGEEELDRDLDIDLEPAQAAPQQAGGCRGVTVLLVVLLAAAVIFAIWYSQHVQQLRQAALEAKMQRETVYKAQFGQVAKNVEEAVALAGEGQVKDALVLLEKAEKQLTVIGASANEADDQQWAAYAMTKKQALLDAKNVIAAEYDKYQEAVAAQFDRLASKFRNADLSGGTAIEQPEAPPEEPEAMPEAPPAGAEQQPTVQDEGASAPVAGEEAPREENTQPARPEEPPLPEAD